MSYFLSDRYETVRTVYEAAATKVVLVRAIDTGELFIIKGIRKGPDTPEHFFLEASLLRDLSHPGIPTLYDTQEDEQFFYMVEEYVCGDPLDQYLLYHQHISQITFLQIAMQLCQIILYLHTSMPEPILYLDLKPEHIIVCGNRVKLIDFGIAKILTSSGNDFQIFGTKKYAAPEQIFGGRLDERTDIYGIGKILAYMLDYLPLGKRYPFVPVTAKCLHYQKSRRIADISRLLEVLQGLLKKIQKEKRNGQHLLYEIAVTGSGEGVGCTHVAVALVCYLNQAGFYAYYRNETEQPVLERMVQQDMADIYRDGMIYHDYFRAYMNYGPAVGNSEPPKGIAVIDCGCQEACKADATIYVCSGRIWQRQQKRKEKDGAAEYGRILLLNHGTRFMAARFAREQKQQVYLFPYTRDPFYVTWREKMLFSKMVERDLSLETTKKRTIFRT